VPVDALACDQCHRLCDADVQRGVHDAGVAEAKHQKHVVLVGAGLACDEARIAVKLYARRSNRRLILRRGNDSIDLTGERRAHGPARARQRRASKRRAVLAEHEVLDLRHRHVEHREPRRGRVLGVADWNELSGDVGRLRVAGAHARSTEDDRPANGLHRRVKRGRQTDFRADAGRISGRDGNTRCGL
jgi:hypothetical protein